jgi:hypothetical protein
MSERDETLDERDGRTVEREKIAVEILTALGWYRGTITLPSGGRLLDYLNTKPDMIALTNAVLPAGDGLPFIALNTEQVLAIRPQAEA